tara:strand:- start:39 stop:392 length:354 start_codon:yes stop_codon:yes gene_type:complete
MIFNIIKVLITALVIVAAAEVAKRSSLLAGLIVSMPLITVLTLMWLYWDTKDIKQVSDLTNNTLLMILPSLTFFLFFPILLKLNLNFPVSMLIAIISTAICYWGYTIFLNKFFNISL